MNKSSAASIYCVNICTVGFLLPYVFTYSFTEIFSSSIMEEFEQLSTRVQSGTALPWPLTTVDGYGSCGSAAPGMEDDLAIVSYYVAQSLSLERQIRVPVPCTSRINVTSVRTGLSVVASIVKLCKYCRSKHIHLSPSAFEKLHTGVPDPQSNSGTLNVSWVIDGLVSPQTQPINSTVFTEIGDSPEKVASDLAADLRDGEAILRLKASLGRGEPCDMILTLMQQAVLDENTTHLFELHSPDGLDHEVTTMLKKRYELEKMGRTPGKFCDNTQNLVCTVQERCDCHTEFVLYPDKCNYTVNEGFVCMVDQSGAGGAPLKIWNETCPAFPDSCILTRDGDHLCSAKFKSLRNSNSTITSYSFNAVRFNSSGEEDERQPQSTHDHNCVCMDANYFHLRLFSCWGSELMLRFFSLANGLTLGSTCDPAAEKLHIANLAKLRLLSRGIKPTVVSAAQETSITRSFDSFEELDGVFRILDGTKFVMSLFQSMDAEDDFCDTEDLLTCTESGACACYTNQTSSVTLVPENDVCVLTKGSVCDPAYWGRWFEDKVGQMPENGRQPGCELGLPCVDMSTGKACARNATYFSASSASIEWFPFIRKQPPPREDAGGSGALTLRDYCRCHETFEIPLPVSLDRVIWPFMVGFGALIAILIGMAVWYQLRLRTTKINFLLRLTELERRLFLDGDTSLHEEPEVMQDGGTLAQVLPYNAEAYEISPRCIEYGQQRGGGAFGMVVEGVLRINGTGSRARTRQVAIKKCRDVSDLDAIRCMLAEIKILSFIGSHANVVEFVGAVTADVDVPALILELCEHGSLKDLLRKSETMFLDQIIDDQLDPNFRGRSTLQYDHIWIISTSDLLCWSYQIANGMDFLGWEKAVIHGDLFLKNILVASNGVAKITDFGLSKRFEYDGKSYVRAKEGFFPPAKLLPPEARTEPRKLSPALDVWTFGILLWEMFTLGQQEPDCITSAEELRMLAYVPNTLDAVMRRCWAHDPAQRISFMRMKYKIQRMLGDGVDPAAGVDLAVKYIKVLPNS